MKKYILSFLFSLCATLPSWAVLQEESLARTLGVLRLELYNNWKKQKVFMARYQTQQEAQHKKLVAYMQRSEQISLMLYSQKSDYVFDIAYSCQQATKLHEELNSTNVPYNTIRNRMRNEIARHDSLIYALEQLPPATGRAKKEQESVEDSLLISVTDTLGEDSIVIETEQDTQDAFFMNDQEIQDREKCLIYAKALRNNIIRMYNNVSRDQRYYKLVSDKVNKLNKYAEKKYKELQKNIFVRGENNYLGVLFSIKRQWAMIKMDYKEKYTPIKETDSRYSEWRGPALLFSSVFMVFYIIVGMIISSILINLLPKRFRTESYYAKRPAIITALGVLFFIIAILIIRNSLDRNVFRMSTALMINIGWLIEVVLISILFRLNNEQIRSGMKIYLPFITLSFLAIMFRIVLIPNSMLMTFLPPILLVCSIWQIITDSKNRSKLPLSDKTYCTISTLVIVSSATESWFGYNMLAIQIIVWWTFQLAAIHTITCIYDILKWYQHKFIVSRIRRNVDKELSNKDILTRAKKGDFISYTWLYDMINIAIVPVLSVISVIVCIILAAETFEMTAFCRTIFFTNFIDEKGVIQISLFKLCLVVACYYIFKYINYAARSFYFHFKRSYNDNSQGFNKTFARNIIQILVWGTYFIAALVLLKVPRQGLEIIGAGLASGLGFASRGLLENFFYGISLMSGRVRVGDYIECDGIIGKVESITYQSTQIVTLDGSIIAFLNSALFNKNFKNLTKNHQYALEKIPVGVAYGSDVNKVRQHVLDALKPICTKTDDGREIISPDHPLELAFSGFGDSSIDLVLRAWLLVDQQIPWVAKAREIIYNTLNENGIEIPFPQRDLHIIQ